MKRLGILILLLLVVIGYQYQGWTQKPIQKIMQERQLDATAAVRQYLDRVAAIEQCPVQCLAAQAWPLAQLDVLDLIADPIP